MLQLETQQHLEKMHAGWSSCLEVLLQLPGQQVQLVEALQKRPDAHKAVVLDLHHAPDQRLQLPLDHNHLQRRTTVSVCPCTYVTLPRQSKKADRTA